MIKGVINVIMLSIIYRIALEMRIIVLIRFDWACSWMVLSSVCKLPSTSPSIGLSRIQHLIMKWQNFEIRYIRRCVYTAYHGTFNVTLPCHSMKSGVCSLSNRMRAPYKTRKLWANKTKCNFERGAEDMKHEMKHAYHRYDVKRQS
jgi:hypothetical protein